MERLTTRIGDTVGMAWEHEEKHTMDEWVDMLQTRLCEYEDTGLTPDEITALAEAIREERVLILPCPIGTPVYVHEKICTGAGSVLDCKYGRDCPRVAAPCPYRVVKRAFSMGMRYKLGITFWLTEAEAEAAIPADRRNRP